MGFTAKEKELVRMLHELPLVEQPYRYLAEQLGKDEKWVLGRLVAWKRNGALRKLAVVGRHRRLGYRVNVMLCWQLPAGRLRQIGKAFARLPLVSHCYRRKPRPGWPWELYTMLHARSEGELRDAVAVMQELAGGREPQLLRTRKEFKKTSPAYFTDQGS